MITMPQDPHPDHTTFLRRIRSFVRRDSRLTEGQKRVLTELWPHFGIELSGGYIDFAAVFGGEAPLTVEIGFGSGQSLLAIAKAHPEQHFVGVETYQPGIGSLLLGIEALQLRNIRVIYADAVIVLTKHIAEQAVDTFQVFFPDPWPKRKHHKRRLIQPEFVTLLHSKLKPTGLLHLATDWQHYAEHMLAVLTATEEFENVAGVNEFATRSKGRPIETKFEMRGTQHGRAIRELQFIAKPSTAK